MKSKYLFLCILSLLASACANPTTTTIDKQMKESLKKSWINLIGQFTTDEQLMTDSWRQIEQHYTAEHRAYHNLTHINNMLQEATKFEGEISDKEVVLLAIWLHDIIYDPLSKNNEKDSAELAKNILSQTNLSLERIQKCYDLILLTIKHQLAVTAPLDDKLLIDFDLEILSRNWLQYKTYSEQIRQEYWMYPTPLFKSGRKEAMGKFLERPNIYQTPFYREEKEAKARANIKREMEELL